MQILNINKFYYLRGGAERYYFALSKLLEEYGHEVIPFSMEDQRNFKSKYSQYFVPNIDYEKPGLKMFRYAGRSVWSLTAQQKIAALLDDTKPKLAHIHLIYHHISPSILPELKKRKIPVIMTLHDYKMICPNYSLYTRGEPCTRCRQHKYYNAVLRRCLKNSFPISTLAAGEMYLHKIMQVYEKNVDVFIAPSQFVKDRFVDFGQDPRKIVVIPHFIDPDFWENAKITTRSKLGKNHRKFVLYFGRLSEQKGLDKLLKIMYINKPDWVLKIAGTGPLQASLNRYIGEKKLEDRVKMVGYLNTQELVQEINACQAVVLPSRVHETFGFTALEAIAMNKPVVCYNVGALPEIVSPEVGKVVPLDDAQAFYNAIEQVIAWDQKALSVNTRKLIESKYLPDQHYQSLSTVYEHLVG